MFFLVPALA